jgi:hypothetical protein
MLQTLERGRWGATAVRPEVCDAGECYDWWNTKLGVEEETKQKSEEEAGGGDLLPEMDWAEPLWSRPRLRTRLLSVLDRGRTRKPKPEESAERAGITMIVWVRDQEQERDGEQDEGRCSTTPFAYPPTIVGNLHLPSPHD